MAVLKPWDEKKLNTIEEMVVIQPTRIKGEGDDVARLYNVGEKVKVKGLDKKDMYFRNRICYPEDFELIKKEGLFNIKISNSAETMNEIKKGAK